MVEGEHQPATESTQKQATPESQKPRVQLELTSKTSSHQMYTCPAMQQQDECEHHQPEPNEEEDNLELLKTTMASLELHKNCTDVTCAANYLGRHAHVLSPAEREQQSQQQKQKKQREPDQYRQEAARLEKQHGQLVARVAELQSGTGEAASMTIEQRADCLNALFTDELLPLLRAINAATTSAEVDEQLFYQQTLEHQNRGAKAEIIRQKYEQITREYQNQNKQFSERHTQIASEEAAKREKICQNFDEHLETIKSQMASDVAQSQQDNDMIRNETEELETKYEELKKECSEKMELMSAQLADQDGKHVNIEEALSTQINGQHDEIKRRVETYKEQTQKRVEEEKQLLTVLKEYKQKYQEFQKATKVSKQNQKKFAKDVKALGNHQRQLEADHKALCASLDIHNDMKEDAEVISDLIKERQEAVTAMEAGWTNEKAELIAQADALKEECSQLQEQVRIKKAQGASAAAAAQ